MLVIEDSDKATEFLEDKRATLTEDLDNRIIELTAYDGMGENNARKQAMYELLRNSGIGFYEAYASDEPKFKKVKSQKRKPMKKSRLFSLYATMLVCCVCCENSELNSKRMFANKSSFYINKPIKNLILDSKYKLKHYSFVEADSYLYLEGIFLTFSNDVKIFLGIEDFKFQTKRRHDRSWDINKCILERASEIELVTDKPVHYKQFKQKVTIEFIAKDSIVLHDDFYHFYRPKIDSLRTK